MGVIYRMDSSAPPGRWIAPGNPDIIPSGTVTPPPSNNGLVYGTTMFGQSWARYKSLTLGSGAPRYNAVENDTMDVVGGVTRRGSGVTRTYGNATPGVWTDAHPAFMRSDHPVIYSFGPNSPGPTQAVFKSNLRAFFDSKPNAQPHCWLVCVHEADKDWFPNPAITVDYGDWLNWNLWMREVKNEAAYASRTDITLGMITTGGPWGKNTAPLSDTTHKGWQKIYNDMNALRGPATVGGPNREDTWDFLGIDRYNPAWNGLPPDYMTYDNWAFRIKQAHAQTGKVFVVGETGSPRADIAGQTLAQQDLTRANWFRDQANGMLADGFFDAVAWWRVPALTGFANSGFSTIMITPTGYNAELAASTPPIAAPPGGVDAQIVVDTLSEFAIASMIAANPPISFQ